MITAVDMEGGEYISTKNLDSLLFYNSKLQIHEEKLSEKKKKNHKEVKSCIFGYGVCYFVRHHLDILIKLAIEAHKFPYGANTPRWSFHPCASHACIM